MPRDVTVAELGSEVGATLVGAGDAMINDVTHDSRTARPGSLFVAVRGLTVDGHGFVPDAVRRGVSALCVDTPQRVDVSQLLVPDTRGAMPLLAAAVHHHPCRSLEVVGITGTNGKTTVAYLLESIFSAAGMRSAVIGTIGARIAGRPLALGRTTPESTDLQRLLAEMVRSGVRAVAMEVSSHALALGRVDGMTFRVAAFTNLTQDHLDFHGDMEGYFAAKASLFSKARTARAAIWVDDLYGRRLAGSTDAPVIRVSRSPEADVHAEGELIDTAGARFVIVTAGGRGEVRLPLVGAFNVDNALVAAACAEALGIGVPEICLGLGSVAQIPGRFERVDEGQPFAVVVDYAHTPEGVAAAVAAARVITAGSVVVVVGAGGDRDRAKRPLMGAAATEADQVIITSDNPRSEDPLAIISEVAAGTIASRVPVSTVPDRRAAIAAALARAIPGDVVLILGKGHEQGQEYADRVEPFDDRAVAREELRRLEVAG